MDPAADVARALELAPDDPVVLQVAAKVARSRGDLAGPGSLLEHARELHPGIAAVYQSLSDLEREAGRFDLAADFGRAGPSRNSRTERGGDLAVLRWTLADLLILGGGGRGRPGHRDLVRETGPGPN